MDKKATPAQLPVKEKTKEEKFKEQWAAKWEIFQDLFYNQKRNVFKDDYVSLSFGRLSHEDVRYCVLNRLQLEKAFGVKYDL